MPFPVLHPAIARALAERDYNEPTPVQAAVLEAGADGRDLLVSAQTGSGKTVAYGLAFARDLLGDPDTAAAGLDRPSAPLALVVAPTRELALQVHRELTWLYAAAGARVVSCVGGMDPKAERRRLAEGAHIVVGTPGRLRDHVERGGLDLSALAAVVLDEADEMLDLGFREDLEFLLEATPESRRTLLFSATLPKDIVALAERFQDGALRIRVEGGERGHADIEYRAVRVFPNEIEHAVVNLLRLHEAPAAIVFCNTRNSVRHLQAVLLERGFSVVALSGELGQGERNQALQALRDGRARVCVATDVAARGIDLPGLALVIHAELPNDAETLQHRSGRTGRAGRKGISVLLVARNRRRKAETLMVNAGIVPIWSGPPTPEEIRALDRARLLADPILTEPAGDDDREMADALLAERSAEDLAMALARLYRSRLPAAEDVGDPGEGRGAGAVREPRGSHAAASQGGTGGVWFRMDIGRNKRADPKWLLPLICRQGGIGREHVGTIRIFPEETRFEIAPAAVATFLATIQRERGEAEIVALGPDAGEPVRGPRGKPGKGFKGPKRPREARGDDAAPQAETYREKPPRKAFDRPEPGQAERRFEKPKRSERHEADAPRATPDYEPKSGPYKGKKRSAEAPRPAKPERASGADERKPRSNADERPARKTRAPEDGGNAPYRKRPRKA